MSTETIEVQRLVEAKSDQINAVDLIGGPITTTIQSFKIRMDEKQPIELTLSGQEKPWRPCLTVRRVLVNIWGHYTQWPGRSLTLYCDQSVVYGGDKVGGIRVSHMEGITEDKHLMVKKNKKSYMEYVVKPLLAEKSNTTQFDDIISQLQNCADAEALEKLKTSARAIYSGLSGEQKKVIGTAINAAEQMVKQ